MEFVCTSLAVSTYLKVDLLKYLIECFVTVLSFVVTGAFHQMLKLLIAVCAKLKQPHKEL